MPGYRGGYGGRQPGRGVTLSTRGTLSRGVVKRRVMGRPMYGDPPPQNDQRGRVGGQITIDATREVAGEPGGGAGNPVPVANQCPHCRQGFPTPAELQRHIQEQHSTTPPQTLAPLPHLHGLRPPPGQGNRDGAGGQANRFSRGGRGYRGGRRWY